MSWSIGTALAERGLVPTPVVRAAIRRLCAVRLREAGAGEGAAGFLAALEGSRIAEVPELANAQHYEVPAEFFDLVLGRRRKYSCALWEPGTGSLDAAEEAALALVCERAGIEDGQEILELGCGWGSLSGYLAERFPGARIVAVSNSAPQRARIESFGYGNLEVRTADMNRFDAGRRFDRIVSVEMFEHLRDWRRILARAAGWLEPDGRLFIHVFCQARFPYTFETERDDDWMGRHFFTGGIMPSYDLLAEAATGAFAVEDDWWLDGTHYQRTAAAWRERLEANREPALRVLGRHYGGDAGRWYHRWRLFFLACEELFGYAGGREWGVGHYRLAPAATPAELSS
ncbi:MAG: cyclopropane-fatty-acyl-phospholipid synthase family protein [Gemmatimonadales bacterium]